jgi:predicted GIY-YIG superfamily endonuclease
MRSTDSKPNYCLYKLGFEGNYFYIGVTNNLKRRVVEHKREKPEYKLQTIEVIEANLTEGDAYIKETNIVTRELITNNFCLNKTVGGKRPDNKMINRRHSPSTKQKMSDIKKDKASKGLLWSQQDINKKILRERFVGKNNPTKRKDVRDKISKAKLGILNPRYGRSGTMRGKTLTDAQRSKISYQIQTPDGIFLSSVEAAKHYKCAQQTIINRCNSEKYRDWIILNKGAKYNA